MIVVIDHDEVAQLQVTGRTCGFAGNTLHGAAITKNTECMVVNKLEAWLVEMCSSLSLSNCQSNGICEALTQWASSNLNPLRILAFGMAGCDAVNVLPVVPVSSTLSMQFYDFQRTRKFLISSNVSL